MLKPLSFALVVLLAVGCGQGAEVDDVEAGTYTDGQGGQIFIAEGPIRSATLIVAKVELGKGELREGLLFTETCGVYSIAAREGRAWVEWRRELSGPVASSCQLSRELTLVKPDAIQFKRQRDGLAYGMGDVDN